MSNRYELLRSDKGGPLSGPGVSPPETSRYDLVRSPRGGPLTLGGDDTKPAEQVKTPMLSAKR